VAALPQGGFLIAEEGRVRQVDAAGVIRTVAGNGALRYGGDGGPALKASLNYADNVAALADGGFLVSEDNRVRRVDPAGVITTVAGTGRSGYSGDGGPATRAAFDFWGNAEGAPGLAPLPDGGFLIADVGNVRVRRIGANGIVHTVAGTGRDDGPLADGGPATGASLSTPLALLAEADGGFLIGDVTDKLVRRVDPRGMISTVVGRYDFFREPLHGLGTAIFDGDGRSAAAGVISPTSLAREPDGSLVLANEAASRIMSLSVPGLGPPAIAITGTRVTAHDIRVGYTASRAGQLRGTAIAGRSRATLVGDAGTPGSGTVRFRRPRRRGVIRLELTLGDAGGTLAGASVGVLVGPLSRKIALAAVNRFYADTNTGSRTSGPCRRYTARRVDCAATYTDEADGSLHCSDVHSVNVGHDGLARFREYRCGGQRRHWFKRRPRWHAADAMGRYPPFDRRNVTPAPLLRG
jgi:hypothetical protein